MALTIIGEELEDKNVLLDKTVVLVLVIVKKGAALPMLKSERIKKDIPVDCTSKDPEP